MRVRTLLTTAAALSLTGLSAGVALASDNRGADDDACAAVPRAEWKSVADAAAAVEARGYRVVRIKTDDGCYEADARDEAGVRYELLIDPVSLAIVDQERDD
jgi:hypothetical protein